MAAPNSQFPAGSGSKNPTIVPKKVISLSYIYILVHYFNAVFNIVSFSLEFFILLFFFFLIFLILQEAEEQDAFSIERERLAVECKAIK